MASLMLTSSCTDSFYNLISDPESQTIDFILAGPSGADDASALASNLWLSIAEERRDCMVFVSPPK